MRNRKRRITSFVLGMSASVGIVMTVINKVPSTKPVMCHY